MCFHPYILLTSMFLLKNRPLRGFEESKVVLLLEAPLFLGINVKFGTAASEGKFVDFNLDSAAVSG